MTEAERPTVEQRIQTAIYLAEHEDFGIFPVWSAYPSGMCKCPRGPACTSPGKHPISPKGFLDATRDRERIRNFLSAGSEPNYGLLNPDGVFTWDADGVGWQARLHALEERYGPLPDTLTTVTANGEHIFFRWPDDIGPRPMGEMFGFVTRWGSGRGAGYVIGPNSIHPSGAVYRRLPGAPVKVALLPAEWAKAALGPPQAPTGEGGGGVHLRIEAGGYTLPDKVGDGGRYDAIVSYTAHLYNRGFSTNEMWGSVLAELAPRFDPPLPETDLRDRFERAIRGMPERLGERRNLPGDGEGGSRAGADDRPGPLPPSEDEDFPGEIQPDAFGGLVGEIVDALAPGTDAAREGLLASLLPVLGAVVPVRLYWNRWQQSQPFVALIGKSGEGRKSTAIYRAVDSVGDAIGQNVMNGLLLAGISSGEAIVASMSRRQEAGTAVALVLEEEFARVVAARSREGATLDPMLRAAFDGGQLANLRSDSSRVVMAPYWLPALVAITPGELQSLTTVTDVKSGSGNRWLYICVRRRDVRADGSAPILPLELKKAIQSARDAASPPPELQIAEDAKARLEEYDRWVPTVAGMAIDMTQRMAVHALRAAIVQAGVERASTVSAAHVDRAIALADYGRRGLAWAFGPALIGNKDTRLLYRHLVEEGRLRTRAIDREIIRDPIRRQDAIDDLVDRGLARVERGAPGPRGGRPTRELVLLRTVGGSPVWAREWAKGVDTFTGKGLMAAPAHAREAGEAEGEQEPDSVTIPPNTRETAVTIPGQYPDSTAQNHGNTSGAASETVARKETAGEYIGKRSDGSIWCYFWKEHSGQHRDVQSDPWCQICSPEGDEGG
jgi:hypothetical protein